MSADWTKPAVASTYTNFVAELNARDTDLAVGLDPAVVTPTSLPTNALRWNSVNGYWEKYNGTAWAAMAATYNITISGSAAKWTTARTISIAGDATGSASVDGSANASISITLGTVTAPKGGTGQTTYAVGDILYANTATTLARLADVATGNVMISGGVGVAPNWGQVGLTTHVTGTLGVGNGGTGTTTLSGVVFGNGAGAMSAASAAQIVAAIGATAVTNATNATSATSASSATNAGTVGGLTPSAAAGTANRVVVADASGYINNTYFNGSDEGTSGTAGTVTGILTKRGDNYYRTTNAASIAAYLTGQTMNINGSSTSCSGNAATASDNIKFMSTSHNGTYWTVNNWDGTYWYQTTNHGAPVRVGYADVAGSATTAGSCSGNAATATTATGVSLVNNTGASSDLSLVVGQSAYIDYSAVTSVALHIATGDNQSYEVTVNATGNTGSAGNVFLNPNNTTYANFFIGNIWTEGVSAASALAAYFSAMLIGYSCDPRYIKFTASTKTASKSVEYSTFGYTGTSTYINRGFCGWQATASTQTAADTTTAWSSLGTLAFPVASTGRILIKRLM